MYRVIQKSPTETILENIIFLEEIFGNNDNEDIPRIPLLELARCFQQPALQRTKGYRRRRKDWPLWK